MRILFIIEKLELKYFEFNKLVTDFWLIREFLLNNYEVFVATKETLFLENNKAFSNVNKAFLCNENGIRHEQTTQKEELNSFDCIMFRSDPPVDIDFINATYILDFVDRTKTFVINDSCSIRNFNEKIHILKFKDYIPKTLVSSDKKEILKFIHENNEIILKPLNRCFGSGVYLIKKDDINANSIINSLTENSRTCVMAQKRLRSKINGDKRVLILGEEVLNECVYKLANKNDFKFSTHNDIHITKAELSKQEKIDFTAVAQELNALGLYMAGLDVIDGKIIEINITSPCYFIKEINHLFSIELEKKIFGYLNNKIKNYFNKEVHPLEQNIEYKNS